MTDDSGVYQVTGVPPGPGLRAYAEAGEAGLLSRWYTDPGQGRDSFDLARGQVRNDLDFALIAGAVAIGQVLDGQTGDPLPGVTVDLVDVDNPLNSYISRTAGAGGADSGSSGPVAVGRRHVAGPERGWFRASPAGVRAGVAVRDRPRPAGGVLADRVPG